ncbi:type II toxin-antitoxin system RelB/DinJ family antitoxin [Candidatus Kaiserbacteria bacterium]|nr:MAG: type II toxin-antitoxin system RelB/DinJ family antitoxin [Candidatus Kaiserbacteria bacterium]
MKTTMINIKTDKKVKEEAQKLAEELGFTLSSFITASLKQFIRTRSVQFSAGYKMTPYLEGIIKEVEEDLKTGKNLSPVFTNAKDMDAYLFDKKNT